MMRILFLFIKIYSCTLLIGCHSADDRNKHSESASNDIYSELCEDSAIFFCRSKGYKCIREALERYDFKKRFPHPFKCNDSLSIVEDIIPNLRKSEQRIILAHYSLNICLSNIRRGSTTDIYGNLLESDNSGASRELLVLYQEEFPLEAETNLNEMSVCVYPFLQIENSGDLMSDSLIRSTVEEIRESWFFD